MLFSLSKINLYNSEQNKPNYQNPTEKQTQIAMPLNPEVQKLADLKFSSVSKLVPFEVFQKQKQERKKIEEQRKIMELNVAHLYRQAKKAAKQLNSTQAALIENLKRKNSKEEQNRLKQQFKRVKNEQLHQQRNNNSLSRYMNMLKRQQARNKLNEQNKEISMYIKERQKHDQTLRKIKAMQQSRMNIQKNMMMQNSLKMGIEMARRRNRLEKKCLSSVVRNDLLQIENNRIEEERLKVEGLKQKKSELYELFQRTKDKNNKYKSMLQVGIKNKSYIEMYEMLRSKEGQNQSQNQVRKKKLRNKKRKYFSQRKMIG